MVRKPKPEPLLHVEKIDTSEPAVRYHIPERLVEVARLEGLQLTEELAKAERPLSPRASEDDHFHACLSELVFQGVLYQYEVPHIRNPVFLHEPHIEWREYDFWTPIGTVDVKATSPSDTYTRLLINQQKWDALPKKPDVVVAIKLLDSYEGAFICGCIRGSDVNFQYMQKFLLPNRNPETDTAYSLQLNDYEKLKPGNKLIEGLRKSRAMPLGKWGLENLFQ